jgi:hypothetical protein
MDGENSPALSLRGPEDAAEPRLSVIALGIGSQPEDLADDMPNGPVFDARFDEFQRDDAEAPRHEIVFDLMLAIDLGPRNLRRSGSKILNIPLQLSAIVTTRLTQKILFARRGTGRDLLHSSRARTPPGGIDLKDEARNIWMRFRCRL